MHKLNVTLLADLLNKKVALYNRRSFIEADPISIPHQYKRIQDIEISAFFAALFAWGNRTTIINKANELMKLMGNSPFDFIQNHKEKDLEPILKFKHRTFQSVDVLFLISFLSAHYKNFDSLEDAFFQGPCQSQEERLCSFYNYVFSFEHLKRTEKHIASPAKKSACKRINMFLRWMVRKDLAGVDFGLWSKMGMSELIMPLDLHVVRIAQKLKLIETDKANWQQAISLTTSLCKLDPSDPVKYDYALFGMGVLEGQEITFS